MTRITVEVEDLLFYYSRLSRSIKNRNRFSGQELVTEFMEYTLLVRTPIHRSLNTVHYFTPRKFTKSIQYNYYSKKWENVRLHKRVHPLFPHLNVVRSVLTYVSRL